MPKVGDKPDNSKIKSETTHEPSVQDTQNYRPALPSDIYEFMDHSFFGTGGYRDGTYLIPHSRELFYDARRELSFYKNFVLPIIRAMIDPVFNEPAERTVNGQPPAGGNEVSIFIQNCDNAGTPLHRFMMDAVQTARLHGVTYVIIDNFTELPDDQESTLNERRLPYVYIKRANEVEAHRADAFGNLEEIIFTEEPVIVQNEQTRQPEKEKRFSRWDSNKIEILKKNKDSGIFEVVDTRIHGLGRIPIVPILSTKRIRRNNLQVPPPLYDIAKMNHAIFNKDSEIRDQERAQGFSVFYFQTDKPGNVNLGTHAALALPAETKITPGFASPDANILKGLMETGKMLVDDIFRIAGQHGVIGIEKKESGIAKQWDFMAHETVLKQTSRIAQNSEISIIDVFKLYVNQTFTYNVEYPMDFKPENTSQELGDITSVLDMGMPPKAEIILKGKAFQAVTQDIEKEARDEALEQFTEDEIARRQSEIDDLSNAT